MSLVDRFGPALARSITPSHLKGAQGPDESEKAKPADKNPLNLCLPVNGSK